MYGNRYQTNTKIYKTISQKKIQDFLMIFLYRIWDLFDTKYVQYRIWYFFQFQFSFGYQIVSVPNPILFLIPNFSLPNPIHFSKNWKSLETEKFWNRNVTLCRWESSSTVWERPAAPGQKYFIGLRNTWKVEQIHLG